jgi:hypothetical protein
VAHGAPAALADLDRADPVRRALGQVLLEEAALLDAAAEALHRDRPVAQVRQHRAGDRAEVVVQVVLGQPVGRPQQPVGVGQLHLARRRAHL